MDHGPWSRHNLRGRFTSTGGAGFERTLIFAIEDSLWLSSFGVHVQIPAKLKGTDMDFQALEIELTKMAVWVAAAQLLAFCITMFVLYLVIKAAIRDGINESKLVNRTWQEGAADPMARDAVRAVKDAAKVLPPMRAD